MTNYMATFSSLICSPAHLLIHSIVPNWTFLLPGVFSVQFSHSVNSDSLQSHGPQHARLPCPSPTPRAYSTLCSSSRWCHPTISSSVTTFSISLQSFPASGFVLICSIKYPTDLLHLASKLAIDFLKFLYTYEWKRPYMLQSIFRNLFSISVFLPCSSIPLEVIFISFWDKTSIFQNISKYIYSYICCSLSQINGSMLYMFFSTLFCSFFLAPIF